MWDLDGEDLVEVFFFFLFFWEGGVWSGFGGVVLEGGRRTQTGEFRRQKDASSPRGWVFHFGLICTADVLLEIPFFDSDFAVSMGGDVSALRCSAPLPGILLSYYIPYYIYSLLCYM